MRVCECEGQHGDRNLRWEQQPREAGAESEVGAVISHKQLPQAGSCRPLPPAQVKGAH